MLEEYRAELEEELSEVNKEIQDVRIAEARGSAGPHYGC